MRFPSCVIWFYVQENFMLIKKEWRFRHEAHNFQCIEVKDENLAIWGMRKNWFRFSFNSFVLQLFFSLMDAKELPEICECVRSVKSNINETDKSSTDWCLFVSNSYVGWFSYDIFLNILFSVKNWENEEFVVKHFFCVLYCKTLHYHNINSFSLCFVPEWAL